MRPLVIVLKVLAPIFLVVGALHLVLGLGADALLGARISPDVRSDPGLDSQNRFYGVAFTLHGVLLYLSATDLPRYATVLRCVLGVFFAAGLARFVSIAVRGAPPPMIWILLVSELLLPPLLMGWLRRASAEKTGV